MDLKLKTLFNKYNVKYFENKLENVMVSWSDKMTLCTGKTYLMSKSGTRNCRIKLSTPILSQRPFEDTLNTLLHEMIHAYLYISKAIGSRESHGKDFKCFMNKININEGSQIKVRHNFLKEVNKFRTNIYKCNGPCRHRRPYFGILRRAIARPPGPEDHWWERHAAECGGTFIKVLNEEPTPTKKTSHHIGKKVFSSRPFRIKELKRTKFLTDVDFLPSGHSLVTADVDVHYKTKLVKFGAEFQKYLNQYNLLSQNDGSSLACDNIEDSFIGEQDAISLKDKFPVNKYLMRLKYHTSTESPNSFTLKKYHSNNSTTLKEKFPLDKYIKRLEDYRNSTYECSPEKVKNSSVEFSESSHFQSGKGYFKEMPQMSTKLRNKNEPLNNHKSETKCGSDDSDKVFPTVVCLNCGNLINKAEYNFHMQFCTKSF